MPPLPVHAIATASKLGGIVRAYEKSKLASREFYDTKAAFGRAGCGRLASLAVLAGQGRSSTIVVA